MINPNNEKKCKNWSGSFSLRDWNLFARTILQNIYEKDIAIQSEKFFRQFFIRFFPGNIFCVKRPQLSETVKIRAIISGSCPQGCRLRREWEGTYFNQNKSGLTLLRVNIGLINAYIVIYDILVLIFIYYYDNINH